MSHADLPTEPTGTLAVRVIAMPADTNPSGDIFGGWLMSWMDLAGGSVASGHAHVRVATVAVDGMVFHRPVAVGDEVSVYGRLTKVGKTSMHVMVEAWRTSRRELALSLVTHATFVFVALNDAGMKMPVPPLPADAS